MTKIHLSILLAAGVFAFAACAKDDNPVSEEADDGDGDGDDPTTGTDKGGNEGEADDSTTGSNFVPDDTDLVDGNTCDPWALDCPEDEKCAAWSSQGDTWDANKCVPLLGTGQAGDECTYNGAAQGTDTCDVGHMCYYTNAEGIGTCIPLCTGSP